MNISRHKVSSRLPLEAFADRLLQLMPRLMRRMVKHDRNYLARGLITLPQLWALRQIAALGTCSMHTLAQAQGLKSSTVTGLMDHLVKLSLVKRFTSETDRRAVLAVITRKGRRILESLDTEQRKATLRLFQHISPRERAIYLEILEKVVNAIAISADEPKKTDTSGEGQR